MTQIAERLDGLIDLLRDQREMLTPEVAEDCAYMIHRDVGGPRARHHADPRDCWCEAHVVDAHEFRDPVSAAARILAAERLTN